MCGAPLVFAILEVLTILWRACEGEFMDEVQYIPFSILCLCLMMYQFNPVYEFTSERVGVTIQLTDSYSTHNEILMHFRVGNMS